MFRSNKYIYAQVIDDSQGKTLLTCDSTKKTQLTKMEMAKEVGLEVAKKCLEKSIKTIVFDRGGYRYHGCVKALAEGVREGGLNF